MEGIQLGVDTASDKQDRPEPIFTQDRNYRGPGLHLRSRSAIPKVHPSRMQDASESSQ